MPSVCHQRAVCHRHSLAAGMVKAWQKSLLKGESTPLLKEAINAFRCAVHFGDDAVTRVTSHPPQPQPTPLRSAAPHSPHPSILSPTHPTPSPPHPILSHTVWSCPVLSCPVRPHSTPPPHLYVPKPCPPTQTHPIPLRSTTTRIASFPVTSPSTHLHQSASISTNLHPSRQAESGKDAEQYSYTFTSGHVFNLLMQFCLQHMDRILRRHAAGSQEVQRLDAHHPTPSHTDPFPSFPLPTTPHNPAPHRLTHSFPLAHPCPFHAPPHRLTHTLPSLPSRLPTARRRQKRARTARTSGSTGGGISLVSRARFETHTDSHFPCTHLPCTPSHAHTSSHLSTPPHTSSHLSHLFTPLHASSHLFTPLHASSYLPCSGQDVPPSANPLRQQDD